MKTFLEFDDAGASDDEPVKGVTVGDIRAWHDQYDNLLASWAECRELLSKERAITTAQVGALRGIETYSKDIAMVNAAHAAIDATLWAIPSGPACASCKKMPRPDCDNPACAFRGASSTDTSQHRSTEE